MPFKIFKAEKSGIKLIDIEKSTRLVELAGYAPCTLTMIKRNGKLEITEIAWGKTKLIKLSENENGWLYYFEPEKEMERQYVQ
jgi:hypothetical protein